MIITTYKTKIRETWRIAELFAVPSFFPELTFDLFRKFFFKCRLVEIVNVNVVTHSATFFAPLLQTGGKFNLFYVSNYYTK